MADNIIGLKEALRDLKKIDLELQKEFGKNAKRAVAPIVDEAKASYPDAPLSGMNHRWSQNGRQLFPYARAKAVRGVTSKFSSSSRTKSVISVIQKDPAAAIFEIAGRRDPNPLANSLDERVGRASRLLWPIAERRIPDVTREIMKLVKVVEWRTNRSLAK